MSMLSAQKQYCPLCEDDQCSLFERDHAREYWQCRRCQLIFVPKAFHLSSVKEKNRYELHENSPDNEDYRAFLNQLFEPLSKRLEKNSTGLDFGSGPGPTLSVMLQEQGHTIRLYDHFYALNPSVFNHTYDFITATEVLEHLSRPIKELERLWVCLKPGGLMGIMTKMLGHDQDFKGWYYKNEPTHVCFYTPLTFRWLAQRWSAHIELMDDNVILIRKGALQ